MEESALKISSRLIIQEVALAINIFTEGQCGQGSLELLVKERKFFLTSLVNTVGPEVLELTQSVDLFCEGVQI